MRWFLVVVDVLVVGAQVVVMFVPVRVVVLVDDDFDADALRVPPSLKVGEDSCLHRGDTSAFS